MSTLFKGRSPEFSFSFPEKTILSYTEKKQQLKEIIFFKNGIG